MKTILVTLSFAGQVHVLPVQVRAEEWDDRRFQIRLKDRLECSPVVLRMQIADENR
jgi:hypothetical protein